MGEAKRLLSQFPGTNLSQSDVEKVFHHFDANRDGALDSRELKQMLGLLATSGIVVDKHVTKVHSFLDIDNDGVVSRQDFLDAAPEWLNAIFNASSALVIVDVQNDFISGSLAMKDCAAGQDGEEVVPVINHVIDKYSDLLKIVVYSIDWHPKDHISFVENVHSRDMCHTSKVKCANDAKVGDTVVLLTRAYGPVEQILWPTHCVQGTQGAELYPSLKVAKNHVRVYKGTDSDIDSYSAFWDNGKRKQTELFDRLSGLRVRDVFVCGLATDYCVGATATHSVEYGFRTALLDDASRGVNLDGISAMKARLAGGNGLVLSSTQLGAVLEKTDRPIEWVTAAIDSVSKLRFT